MMKNSRRKIREWVVTRLPFLWLTLSVFLASYFPAISRYSINTLFNIQKRGYFDFLFTSLQLKSNSNYRPGGEYSRNKEDNSWVRLFGIILFVCCLFGIVFEALSVSYEEQAKQNFKKITDEEFGIKENTEWTKSFSDKVVGDSVTFFSGFCELFIDLWAVISINRTREIKMPVLFKTLFCLAVMLCALSFTRNIIEKNKKSGKNSRFLSSFSKAEQRLVPSELSTIFTALYFFSFSNSDEVINAILLGFNISSILSKLGKFRLAIPRAVSTYKMWKKTRTMLVVC